MQTLRQILSDQTGTVELWSFILNLGLAVIASFVLSMVYTHWGDSLSNRRKFAANFMLVAIGTTFIISVIKSSLALSLGLVGALSIVRFRAAIKEPEELTYLFLAIGLGVGFGADQRLITILAVGVAVLLVWLRKTFRKREANVNLHLIVASHNPKKIDLEEIVDALRPHCSQLELVRFDDTGSALEASFLVEFKTFSNLKEANAALRGLSDSAEITFLDNKGIG